MLRKTLTLSPVLFSSRLRVERASESDRDAIVRLLSDHQLTIEGLHLSTVLVVREGKEIIGTAALEVYRDGALLRSVAIARGQQRRGLGHKLTTAAIRLARDLNVPSIFLLTMTAEDFFTRFGFEQVARADVPESVLASIRQLRLPSERHRHAEAPAGSNLTSPRSGRWPPKTSDCQ